MKFICVECQTTLDSDEVGSPGDSCPRCTASESVFVGCEMDNCTNPAVGSRYHEGHLIAVCDQHRVK